MKFNTSSLCSWRRALVLAVPIALGAALVYAPGADAQPGATASKGAPEVKSQLTAFRVTKADDKETFAPAKESLDGEKFAPAPLKRTVKKADGTLEVVSVPLSEYRTLRWNAGTLTPVQSNDFKARVQIAKVGAAS